MKRIIYKAVLALFVCFSVTSNTYGQYLIEQSKIYSGDVNPETSTDKVKVTYNYDNESINKYYDINTTLSLSDMPVVGAADGYYDWKTSDGIDLLDQDITLIDDIAITGTKENYPNNAGDSIASDYRESNRSDGIKKESASNKSINYSNINVDITDKVINKEVKTYVSLVNDSNNYSNEYSLHAATKAGNAAVNIKLINGSKTTLGDESIGLEAVDEETSDYKPVKGSSELGSSTNYVVYRFKLQNNVILKSNFILGGHNGFYMPKNGGDYLRARQYTGFIVGAYYEIDLNGYDLILANGANLTAYGSITDSSENRTGHLVLENGSTLLTSIVTEGQYHETDIVSAYKYSQDPFRMFRCPYLDCTTIIKTGSKLQGRIIKADGGNSSTVGFASTTTLIGPSDSNPFIQLNSGIIKREVSYNQKLKAINDTNITKNIMYQKIKYSVYDADVDVRWLSFENISISGANFGIYSYKYQMWIPPYFDFYIYNSKVKLHQEFIFMPGVYMYVDSNSEFTFSNTEVESINIRIVIIKIIEDGAQGVAGMVFLPKFYIPSQHGVSPGIIGADASAPIVYHEVDSFYDYYNQFGARCDFYGKMSFSDDDSRHTHKHELGGNINIYDMKQFQAAYESHKDNISLYGNAVFADLVYGVGALGLKPPVFVVGGFYQIPLISNEQCLYDPATNGLVSNAKYMYNSELSLIENVNNSNEKWFFKFTWPSSNMSHPYGSNSDDAGTVETDGDSLLGSFTKASSVDTSNYSLTESGTSYINFQGGYLIANSISGTSSKACLGLAVGGEGTNGNIEYNFTFKTNTDVKFGSPRKYWRKN